MSDVQVRSTFFSRSAHAAAGRYGPLTDKCLETLRARVGPPATSADAVMIPSGALVSGRAMLWPPRDLGIRVRDNNNGVH
jgi:hypothetical protein